MKEGKTPVREVSTDSIQVGSWEAWAPAPRSPPQEQIQKSGSIFPTHKLKVGATQQGRPVQKKKKSPFFPDPRTFKHVAISLRKQEIPPKPHRFPRRTPFQSIPPCWT